MVTGESAALVHERLRSRGWLVWDDHGPASLVDANPPVAGAVRIGPVYTPPERRNRGHASIAVAAASRRVPGRRAPQLASSRGNVTSSSTSLIAAAIGIAIRAPMMPSSAPPITTAITVTSPETLTVRFITFGVIR